MMHHLNMGRHDKMHVAVMERTALSQECRQASGNSSNLRTRGGARL